MKQASARSADVGDVFSALADPTRRAFIRRLSAGELAISDLAAEVPISMPAVSRHVRILAEAGLVHREKRGRTTYLTLDRTALDSASAWIESTRSSWEGALDRLAAHLESE